MPSYKDVSDLKDSIASVGGAMGTWPMRTLWYLCRWERTGQTDPGVIMALQEQNIETLRELSTHARNEYDLDTRTLDRRADALESADVDEIRSAISQAYRDNFGSGMQCPFEREGSDMACHRCPVAGEAIENLRDDPGEGPRVTKNDAKKTDTEP